MSVSREAVRGYEAFVRNRTNVWANSCKERLGKLVLVRLWKLLSPFHKQFGVVLGWTLLFMLLQVGKGYTVTGLLRLFHSEVSWRIWLLVIVGFLGLCVPYQLFDSMRNWKSSQLNNQIFSFVKLHMAAFFLRMGVPWHKQQHSGVIVGDVNHGIEKIHNLIDRIIWDFCPTVLQVTIASVLLFFYSKPSLVVIILALTCFMWNSVRAYRFRHPKREKRYEEYKREWLLFSELVRGVQTIYAFGQRERMMRRYTGHHNRILDILKVELHKIVFWYDPLRKGCLLCSEIALLGVWAWQLKHGRINELDIPFVFMLTQQLLQSCWRFGELFEKAAEAIHATGQIFELLDQEPKDEHGALDGFAVPDRCSIEINNVWFSHPGTEGTLGDINLQIQAGEFIGIVGKTGAGKSTLVSLLLSFEQPDRGFISIGGEDLIKWPKKLCEQLFSVVFQEGHIFPGTIAANIAFGRPAATLEQIQEAAQFAALHEEIESFSGGYLTKLGERGVTLSGGQKQRLLIARAVLAEAPIVILDEPTSAMDSRTELVFMKGLTRLVKSGATVITIAHRLATIQRADRILVLDKGRVIGFAPHAQLLESCPLYTKMVEAQQLQLL